MYKAAQSSQLVYPSYCKRRGFLSVSKTSDTRDTLSKGTMGLLQTDKRPLVHSRLRVKLYPTSLSFLLYRSMPRTLYTVIPAPLGIIKYQLQTQPLPTGVLFEPRLFPVRTLKTCQLMALPEKNIALPTSLVRRIKGGLCGPINIVRLCSSWKCRRPSIGSVHHASEVPRGRPRDRSYEAMLARTMWLVFLVKSTSTLGSSSRSSPVHSCVVVLLLPGSASADSTTELSTGYPLAALADIGRD